MIAFGLFLLKLKSIFFMVLEFTLKNWKIVIPVLIIVIFAFKYQAAIRAKVKAEIALQEHIQQDEAAAKKRAAEIKLNTILAQKKTDADRIEYELKLKASNIDRDKLKKEISRDKTDIMRLIATINRLRDNQSATGMPEVPVSADLLAEGSAANASVSLITGCETTTKDYNQLYKSWMDYCARFGCTNLGVPK
jgi:hypothetical protein